MKRRDIRPAIFRNALGHPDLGNAERVFLVTLVHLPSEYVDGVRRSGSQGIDERGNFALHYDYLARALHTSPENVKKQAQRLVARGFLSKRFPGTFGRPAGFQALDVRGDNTYRITLRPFVPPCGAEDPTPRGDTTSPLPYRTPTDRDHAPAPGTVRPPMAEVESGSEERVPIEVVSELTACPWHEDMPCPSDCRFAPESPADRRRSA